MDKAVAVQLAHRILSSDQPELLASIVAQLCPALNVDEQSQSAQEEAPGVPQQQQHQDYVPRYDASSAPLLYDYQLVMLRNVLASLIPTLHMAPSPERALFSHGLEVLFRQAPQLTTGLHPLIQEARRSRGNNEMEEFIKFVNQ